MVSFQASHAGKNVDTGEFSTSKSLYIPIVKEEMSASSPYKKKGQISMPQLTVHFKIFK